MLRKILLVISIVVLVLGLTKFWIGFHNADTCQNLEDLSLIYEFQIMEKRLDGETWTLQECYLDGLSKLIEGLYIATAGAFFSGIFLVMISGKKHETRR